MEPFIPWGKEDRLIYRFHDGIRVRAVDPADIMTRLQAVKGLALEADLAVASAAEAGGEFATEAQAAVVRLADGVRQAFGVGNLDVDNAGNVVGLSDAECMAVLVNFGEFMGGLAESARPLPNSPVHMDASAVTPSTTPLGSASG